LDIKKKWLKQAKNSLKCDLWYFGKIPSAKKIETALNEFICLQKDSQ
jgi:hypothetical protein